MWGCTLYDEDRACSEHLKSDVQSEVVRPDTFRSFEYVGLLGTHVSDGPGSLRNFKLCCSVTVAFVAVLMQQRVGSI